MLDKYPWTKDDLSYSYIKAKFNRNFYFSKASRLQGTNSSLKKIHDLGDVPRNDSRFGKRAGVKRSKTPQEVASSASSVTRCHWFTIESGLHPTPPRCLAWDSLPWSRIFSYRQLQLLGFCCLTCKHKQKHWRNYTSFCWETNLREWHCHFVWSMVSSLDRLDKW